MESAMSLFGETGFETTSLKAIAERAGLTSAAIYYHYENKQDILFKGLLEAITDLLTECTPAMDLIPQDPALALQDFVRRHLMFQFSERHGIQRTYAALVYNLRERKRLLSSERRAQLADLENRHLDNLRRIILAGIEKGCFAPESVTVSAFSIIAQCEHAIYWMSPKGEASIEQLGDMLGIISLRIVNYSGQQA